MFTIVNFRKTIFSVLLGMSLLFINSVCANAEPGVTTQDGITIITLEGTPYEIGFQQGSLMKEQINQIYKMYLKDLVYDTWIKEYAILGKGGKDAWKSPRKALGKFAKKQEEFIPPEYLEEIKGLAEGAGLEYIDVLNMSAHVDYFAILCSTIVATGNATPDGKLVEARNLDWAQGGLQDLDKFSTVFVVRPDKGHSFVSVLYPGIVGALTAVNDAQITAELNFSMAKENGKSGMPALIMLRHLIQNASTLDEAEAILRNAARFAGYNIMVTDGKTNEARLIEVAYEKLGTKSPENGLLISTNHFITKELAGNNIESSQFSSSPSEDRFNRLVELANLGHGKIDMDAARIFIHDNGVQVTGTVQTIVFKPADSLIWVWSRNRAEDDFVKLDVKKLLADSIVTKN